MVFRKCGAWKNLLGFWGTCKAKRRKKSHLKKFPGMTKLDEILADKAEGEFWYFIRIHFFPSWNLHRLRRIIPFSCRDLKTYLPLLILFLMTWVTIYIYPLIQKLLFSTTVCQALSYSHLPASLFPFLPQWQGNKEGKWDLESYNPRLGVDIREHISPSVETHSAALGKWSPFLLEPLWQTLQKQPCPLLDCFNFYCVCLLLNQCYPCNLIPLVPAQP